MATSLAIIILFGLLSSKLFNKFKLPGLLGMIIAGALIGPYGFDLLSDEIIIASADLRKIALIVILLRAGLGIKNEDIKKVGRPAINMSFIPGLLEGFTIIYISMRFFDFTFIQGGILGFIIAGGIIGMILIKIFKKYNIKDTKKMLYILSSAILLTTFETIIKSTGNRLLE